MNSGENNERDFRKRSEEMELGAPRLESICAVGCRAISGIILFPAFIFEISVIVSLTIGTRFAPVKCSKYELVAFSSTLLADETKT